MAPPSRAELALVLALAGVAAALALGLSARLPALADEFVYLAGAERFAEARSLASTYYFTDSIMAIGHPHQDAHSPGFVIVLGTLSRVFGSGYDGAVALNVVALLVSVWLVWSLSYHLGRPRAVRLMAVVTVTIPALLAYTAWVMPEWLVMALSLTTLWLAVRLGTRPSGALLCGLSLGVCVLVRESGIFLIPALIPLIGASRLRLSLFGGSFLVFQLLIFAPLNAGRPPVATTAVSGSAGNTRAFSAIREGRILAAAEEFVKRTERNLANLPQAGYGQQLSLALLLAMPMLSWIAWPELEGRARLTLIGLSAGFVAMVAATLTVSDLVSWNGPRYWTILATAFLALFPAPSSTPRRAALFIFIALNLVTTLSVLNMFRQFKSHGSSTDEVAYFDRYVSPGSYARVVWQNGYKLGVAHYPAEVIVSIPQTEQEFRVLERAIWFDYVVVPVWQDALDARGRYVLVNGTDPDPLLKIFRRTR